MHQILISLSYTRVNKFIVPISSHTINHVQMQSKTSSTLQHCLQQLEDTEKMRNTSKLNVRQVRNLLSCRPQNSPSSNPFPQILKSQAPKFSSTITFTCKISKPTNSPFTSSTTFLHFSTANKATSSESDSEDSDPEDSDSEFDQFFPDETDVEDNDDEATEIWEEEEEVEPELGDGGDGGGVNLKNCNWGERALALANEAIRQYGDDDLELFAFKTSPKGYVYVRIDKLSTEYGCPESQVLDEFSRQYKKMLDEAGESGELPDDLGLDVSSPGADRLLKVPDDLQRFKHMPMEVTYTDNSEKKCPMKTSVFNLEAVDMETESCTWKLADVKENRDPAAKGRPMSRKQKDWRLQLPFTNCNKVMLYFAQMKPNAKLQELE